MSITMRRTRISYMSCVCGVRPKCMCVYDNRPMNGKRCEVEQSQLVTQAKGVTVNAGICHVLTRARI